MLNPYALKMLSEEREILIFSGEGDSGDYKAYTGKRTERALKLTLTRERCHGDRWARAYIYSHSNDLGKVYVNIENPNDYRHIDYKGE